MIADPTVIQRSVSERGCRIPYNVSKVRSKEGLDTSQPPLTRVRPQTSSTSSSSARVPIKQLTKQMTVDHATLKQVNTNFGTNLTHVLSTPDVGAIRPYYNCKTFDIYGTDKRSKNKQNKQNTGSGHLCTAVSEGELLDLAILPIFQKLLTERHKSRSGYGASIASCPNISIKCDIVEYL